jgi:putative ABC transport system ATP-binding protein
MPAVKGLEPDFFKELTMVQRRILREGSMLHVKDIYFTYQPGSFSLQIPHFSVGAGEKMAVIGPSGSGKTTLLSLVGGILSPDRGTISVNNVELSTLSDTARRNFRISTIGFIFQDFGLLDYLDVRDNILHPYRITGTLTLTKDVRDRSELLAERMGISDKLTRHPPELSHGERQRVAICRALLTRPKIILADEATGNLDPKNKLHIMNLLCESVEFEDATLLAVTHDQELLGQFDQVTDFQNWLTG